MDKFGNNNFSTTYGKQRAGQADATYAPLNTATDFVYFSRLPNELQTLVWEFAARHAQLITFQHEVINEREGYNNIRARPYPSIHDACHEARRVLLQHGLHKVVQTRTFFGHYGPRDPTNQSPSWSSSLDGSPNPVIRLQLYMFAPSLSTLYLVKNLAGPLNEDACYYLLRTNPGARLISTLGITTIAIRFNFSNQYEKQIICRRECDGRKYRHLVDNDLKLAILRVTTHLVIIVYGSATLDHDELLLEKEIAEEQFTELCLFLEDATAEHEIFRRDNWRRFFLKAHFERGPENDQILWETNARLWRAPKVALMSEEELMAQF